MIRFQDTAEKKDAPELLSAAGYLDIKPTSSLSIEGAKSFVVGLFSADSKSYDMYEIDEDSLFTKIFGRCEDEFQFDFELDNEIQSVLARFDSEKWVKSSDGEKMAAINEFGTAIGKRLGLDEDPLIRFYDGPDNSCGAYLPAENSIEINSNILFDAKEVIDTVAHEMRHAYQHQRAMCPETLQDKLYQLNFENYISPIPLADGKYLFFTDYQDQLVEAEARAFANIFTDKEVA